MTFFQPTPKKRTINENNINRQAMLEPTDRTTASRLKLRQQILAWRNRLKMEVDPPQIVSRLLDHLPKNLYFIKTNDGLENLVTRWLVTYQDHEPMYAVPVTWYHSASTQLSDDRDADEYSVALKSWLAQDRNHNQIEAGLSRVEQWKDVAVFAHLVPGIEDPFIVHLSVYGPEKERALKAMPAPSIGAAVEIGILLHHPTKKGAYSSFRMFGDGHRYCTKC